MDGAQLQILLDAGSPESRQDWRPSVVAQGELLTLWVPSRHPGVTAGPLPHTKPGAGQASGFSLLGDKLKCVLTSRFQQVTLPRGI